MTLSGRLMYLLTARGWKKAPCIYLSVASDPLGLAITRPDGYQISVPMDPNSAVALINQLLENPDVRRRWEFFGGE